MMWETNGDPRQAQRALVLGLGASGQAAAELLCRRGWRVVALDAADDEKRQRATKALREQGVECRVGVQTLPDTRFDLCVVSPGIAADSPWVDEARRRCTEVIGELALGARWLRSPMLAITGTNGKSTAAKLCAGALRAAGYVTLLGGNYGAPLCGLVAPSEGADWTVVEVSSFQLELPGGFHPRAGLYLNLQPDHLDRHGDLPAYRRIKARLFDCMTGADVAVVQAAELAAVREVSAGSPRWLSFGGPAADFGVTDDLRLTVGGQVCDLHLQGTVFGNGILAQMVAGVVGLCRQAGVPLASVAAAVKRFEPLPHRLQRVADYRGIEFVDDSKATNLSAMRAAVMMCDRPLRLIAGGRLKENSFDFLKDVLATRVRCVYLIGEAAGAMHAAWSGVVPVRLCGSLDRAVRAAFQDACAGETVLLSPGCASFDQFMDYGERGDKFKTLVEACI